jgi:cytochrome b subunit of formate dehydrogenase
VAKPDRERRFDQVALWALFVLPAITGCIIWSRQPAIPVELAYISWMSAAVSAIALMILHHRDPPEDR